MISRPRLLSATLLFLTNLSSLVCGQIDCSSDSDCPRDSRCSSQGFCRNPFEGGCLSRLLPPNSTYSRRFRTCNSDDDTGAPCRPSPLDYPEIRVLGQNWQEPTVYAWVLQILLSEVANVPVTIETGSSDRKASFYDEAMRWDYADQSYDYEALRRANEAPQNDCRLVTTSSKHLPCAHVLPEAWSGQRQAWREAEQEDLIEPVKTNGRTAKYNWVIPRRVAQEDPTLVSFHGLIGPQNRRKLAQRFKRPLTWRSYCRDVSPTRCREPDATAQQAPSNREQEESYFVEGLYTGYFKATTENDCDNHPHNCTGHIVDYGCQQSTYVVQQTHWLDIALQSSGPLAPSGGYSSQSTSQIWQAANATNSSVIMYFADTNPFQLRFEGTPYEFQRVLLPKPTAECLRSRVSEEDRCSDDPLRRVGSPEGSCDTNALPLQKYVIGNLRDTTFAQPAALRSPAYDVLEAMEISTLDMLSIMKRWQQEHDDERYFGSREAVCHWVASHIDDLVSSKIPNTFPRELQVETLYRHSVLPVVAMGLAVLALLAILVCFALALLWRRRRVIVYAQPVFLNLILSGLLLVAVSALLHATPPSLESCVARQWTSTLGFSLELVPLITKINAINRVFNQSVKMKRITIDRNRLYKAVAAAISGVVVYLVVWTVFDPPTQQSKAVLTDDLADNGMGHVVRVVHYCASADSQAWRIVSLVYLIALLLVATVMATQSRNVRSVFNESKYLAAMIYSHFLFLLLRVLLFFFGGDVLEDYSTTAGLTSVCLSLDAMICLAIYFCPKLMTAKTQNSSVLNPRHVLNNSSSKGRGNKSDRSYSDPDLMVHGLPHHCACCPATGQAASASQEREASMEFGGKPTKQKTVGFQDRMNGSATTIPMSDGHASTTETLDPPEYALKKAVSVASLQLSEVVECRVEDYCSAALTVDTDGLIEVCDIVERSEECRNEPPTSTAASDMLERAELRALEESMSEIRSFELP